MRRILALSSILLVWKSETLLFKDRWEKAERLRWTVEFRRTDRKSPIALQAYRNSCRTWEDSAEWPRREVVSAAPMEEEEPPALMLFGFETLADSLRLLGWLDYGLYRKHVVWIIGDVALWGWPDLDRKWLKSDDCWTTNCLGFALAKFVRATVSSTFLSRINRPMLYSLRLQPSDNTNFDDDSGK